MSIDMQMTYLDFVVERHKIWERRQAGRPQPWTDDPILARKKFTNVFRLLDHGSQFLLTMLQEDISPREKLFRAFLYRHTGRPEPWEFFEVMHGRYPLIADLELARETWWQYQGDIRKVTRADTGRVMSIKQNSVFTGAYLVFPQSQVKGTDKLDSIIDLTKRLFVDDLIATSFQVAKNQAERFKTLQRNPGVGDFMSMQILTDYGYTTEYREDDFIVPGPGCIKGAKVLFPSRSPVDAIYWARGELAQLRLNGRPPSLMDVQNTLCEWSKYHRYMLKPKKDTTLYRAAHPGPQSKPILPLHW